MKALGADAGCGGRAARRSVFFGGKKTPSVFVKLPFAALRS